MDQSIWEWLVQATLWCLFGFSVVVFAVAMERVVVLWRFTDRARKLSDTVNRCLMRGARGEGRSACERSRSPLADVFLVGYERFGRSKPENVDSAVHRERARVMVSLKNRLWIPGTIGATAPFVGLFGTVVGIMEAFRDLERAEGSGQEAGIGVVSGHISEALIATAVGIFVAVIAVIVFNLFNQRIGRIGMEAKMLTDEFLEHLHESTTDDHGGAPTSGDDKDKDKGKGGTSAKEEDADGARKAA
ncbi:MotA/TolQ/ExbB proton channel family protein [Haliangium ochraceum]|uniref:MotA/TolQ/ExbB proton channel n=1 Tax=Haliangium ochraceum (strain DSM 14365 / JCM 11303 / SMP-2) TaxID=502025 RepID=D0LGS1_HALO1|nr:MotA/TolQ/ExbB proton channel family protein [Haliangium ochraceum]ACY14643.1 MotA/TolQ/ExbB proton channel [Haliangium ochraceum DSM 14365]